MMGGTRMDIQHAADLGKSESLGIVAQKINDLDRLFDGPEFHWLMEAVRKGDRLNS